MYQAYQAHADLMWPLRTLAQLSLPVLQDRPAAGGRSAAAASWRRLQGARAGRGHARAAALATSTASASSGEAMPVTEEVVPRHAVRDAAALPQGARRPQPKVLVVAPMSGHFATLLRDTVRTVLQTTTSTSPTGTTCATCRCRPAASASTSTPST